MLRVLPNTLAFQQENVFVDIEFDIASEVHKETIPLGTVHSLWFLSESELEELIRTKANTERGRRGQDAIRALVEAIEDKELEP